MGFNSWRDFQNFERNVMYANRYVHSGEVTEFIGNIKKDLPERVRNLPKGNILFRSQIGYEEIEEDGQTYISGFPPARMKPIPLKGWEGRANPKGISYLYLSTDANTSMAELRPHVGQYISSAQFKINRDLKLIDCYSVSKYYELLACIFDSPISQEDIRYAIWSRINDAFSKPVSNSDSSSDYVPTQILTEVFKSEKYDGVCFKSSMGNGYNVVLFDLMLADLINCTVMETKSIAYVFSECANRYHLQKDKNP